MIYNSDEISDSLIQRYAEISSSENYPHDIFARNDEVEIGLDFETEGVYDDIHSALYVDSRLWLWLHFKHLITPSLLKGTMQKYRKRQ